MANTPLDPSARIERFEDAIDRFEKAIDKIGNKISDKETEAGKLDKYIAYLTQHIEDMKSGVVPGATPHNISMAETRLEDAKQKREKLDHVIQDLSDQLERLGARLSSTHGQLDTARQEKAANEQREAYGSSLIGQLESLGKMIASGQAHRKVAQSINSVTSTVQNMASPVHSVSHMGGVLGQFVQMFSPSTMNVFNQAMRDLSATVGVLLKPVLEALSGVARNVANALLPIAQRLAPIFDQVAKTVVSLLLPVIDTLAAVFETLIPVLQVFADVFLAMQPLMRTSQILLGGWIELLKSLASSFASWLGLDTKVKSFTDGLREAFEKLAQTVLVLVAKFALWIGATSFVDGMIKSIQGRLAEHKDSFGLAAGQNAQFADVSGFGKQVATAAFISTGEIRGAEAKTQEQWLEEIAKALEAAKEGNIQLADKILTKAQMYLELKAAQLQSFLLTELSNALSGLKEAIKGEVYGAVTGFGEGLRAGAAGVFGYR